VWKGTAKRIPERKGDAAGEQERQAMPTASRERGPDLVGASVKKPLNKGD